MGHLCVTVQEGDFYNIQKTKTEEAGKQTATSVTFCLFCSLLFSSIVDSVEKVGKWFPCRPTVWTDAHALSYACTPIPRPPARMSGQQ